METRSYRPGFVPYALGAFLIGIVGGFSTVLGTAFVQDLGLDYQNTTWTALAQAISTAACAPILGKLGDIVGRRRTLLLGLGIFTLGNLCTALANSLAFMLLARLIVGLGTAAIAPVILSYIVTEFPARRVSRGFSVYMLISSASVVFGPSLGGLMIAHWGWRQMIWVCVGICTVVTVLCLLWKDFGGNIRRPTARFDLWGSIWVFVFFALVLCLPSVGQNLGWTSGAFFPIAIGAVLSLISLIFTERRAKNPVLPGHFLRRKAFILSVLALFLTQGLMQANMTALIVFLNYTQGASALSGYVISVMYLGMALGAVIFGPLADRIEPKRVLSVCFVITALGCGSMGLFSQNTPAALLMGALGILGLGLGGNGTVFLKVVLAGTPPEQAGAGTGCYGLFRDLAAPFGVAVLVPLFTNRIPMYAHLGTAQAAVRAIHLLGIIELISVLAGLIIVQFLPKIRSGGTP